MTRISQRAADQGGSAEGQTLSPVAARRRLGAELRTLREKAELKLDVAAGRLQRSAATVSRLETGKAVPRVPDIRELIDLYAEVTPDAITDEVRAKLISLAADGRGQQWFSGYKDVLAGDMTPDRMQYFASLETDATEIRSFQPEVVPGLLQTHAYAEAMTLLCFPEHTAVQRTRFVDFRLARQHVLRRDVAALQMRLVLGETALRRPIGGPDTMREQLSALLKILAGDELPNVELRIAPDSQVSPAVIGGPFLVMLFVEDRDQDVVYLEGRGGEAYLESDAEVAHHVQLFDALERGALDREGSLKLVEGAIRTIT
ncbi:MAG: helix-turn-helix domain-containing protein [Pseudonocardia sp.]